MIVLVATDFSEAAEAADAQALDLVRRLGAEVVYVHVGTEPSLYGESPFGMVRVQAVLEAQRRWATAELERRVQQAQARGVAARYLLPAGVPHLEIVRAAEKEGADMVVLGTHGRTGLERVFLGSVAERVVRLAPCPVLTVRPRRGR